MRGIARNYDTKRESFDLRDVVPACPLAVQENDVLQKPPSSLDYPVKVVLRAELFMYQPMRLLTGAIAVVRDSASFAVLRGILSTISADLFCTRLHLVDFWPGNGKF
jgi:hypothetical protein